MRALRSLVGSMVVGCASTAEETERVALPEAAAPQPGPDVHAARERDDEPEPEPESERDPVGDPWHPLVRETVSRYASWGVVDNQMHWAPGLCALPATGVLHSSVAPAGQAHGEKVFLLRAFDAMAYWKATPVKSRLPATLARDADPLTSRADVRQVLVKESFAPKPQDSGLGARYLPAKKGDAYFGAGDPLGLYVMAQLAPDTPGTDDGWIYATVSAAGEITAAGVIASLAPEGVAVAVSSGVVATAT